MLAIICDTGEDKLPTRAHREGRLTARRLKPRFRLDQKTVSVSSTVCFIQSGRGLDRLVGSNALGDEDLRCASAVALGPSTVWGQVLLLIIIGWVG